jgi:hypothetical protein
MMTTPEVSDAMGLRPKPRDFRRHGRGLQMAGPITLQGMTMRSRVIRMALPATRWKSAGTSAVCESRVFL